MSVLFSAPTSTLRRGSALLLAVLLAVLSAVSVGPTPSASAAAPTLDLVASVGNAGTRVGHTVRVPASVRAGDTLLLHLTTNSISGTLSNPAGWTLLQYRNGSSSRSRLWTKVATATDANRNVTSTSSVTVKSAISVSAYRSTGGTSAVTASAATAVNAASTTHSAPAVPVARAGSWLVSYWSEESSEATTWTQPAGTAVRTRLAGTGIGKISSLLVDSGGAVPTGTAAARVARTSTSVGQRHYFSVVVSPGLAPANRAPVASFTSSCTGLACSFDATGSSDPDGDPLTYAWDFGDGTTATGATASRTFGTPGTRTVTLTVGDGTTTTRATRQVATLANRAPVASFTASCVGLTCAFDASASTDPDGDALTYDWAHGDGSTSTGLRSSRTYTAAGPRTVTLTVSDGTTTASTSRQVSPTAAVEPPEPAPGHTDLVPNTPRTDMPRITTGEIFDIEVVGNRVFIAGTFTGITNNRPGNTTSYAQAGLASYNLDTGLVDAAFRPTFAGGGNVVEAVEASPDGTRLYVAGSFNTVNGVARKGLARLDLTTGAPVTSFTASTDAFVSEIAATNSTVYLGGAFTTVNGVARRSLAAVDGATGAVDPGFVNDLKSGIGPNGLLTVQRLLLTHDRSKLLVVHTGRQVAGEDRYGIALIDTATKGLLPWRTRLWDDNLQFVGGIQRIYGAAIAPDDSYFVVTSGSGGDRPPINDTIIAYSFDGGDHREARWISRAFDSVYSTAISEKAVYIGGHFTWVESPQAADPWPGRADTGYGTGQGLSGYGLGDQVVNREHLAALNPADGKAMEWHPGSNSFEGDKAMEVTPRGLISGGDATTQGGYNVGRIGFYDFSNEPTPNGVDTSIETPIFGRVLQPGKEFTVTGTASATNGVNRVQLEVLNAGTLPRQYLQDDLTTWSTTWNGIDVSLASPGAPRTGWSLPLTVNGNLKLQVLAKTFAVGGAGDPSKAMKKFETFGLDDAPPTASYSSPPNGIVNATTFLIRGSAADDRGVAGVTLTLRDVNDRYLQEDGTISPTYHAFQIALDVPNAPSTTWSHEVTVPVEGKWRAQIRARDINNNASLDTADRAWDVLVNGAAPSVSVSSPTSVIPPTAPQPITVAPGQPMTFTGSATDDKSLDGVDISLINNTTQESLTTDGTWGRDNGVNWYRLKGQIRQRNFNWSYTTPFNLTPGSYTFSVQAVDEDQIVTPSNMRAVLTMNVQVPGDSPPKATLSTTGLQPPVLDSRDLRLSGSATDDKGVAEVRVVLRDQDSRLYLTPTGTMSAKYASVPAVLATPGKTSTTWTRGVTVPTDGDWRITVFAVDTVGQQDLSTSGATARYLVYPGDSAPVLTPELLQPIDGTVFDDGRIFVSGRAEDDQSMAKVEVAIIDSAGKYLSSTGTFGSESWRTAFLTSPGTKGSNFSYTTPVLPQGSYTVRVRGTDQHNLVTANPPSRTVSVTIPAGNKAPTALITHTCTDNVCTFDARSSTDENPTTLRYTWDFGNGTGTGPRVVRTYTKQGTYAVKLTAIDEWGVASAVATRTVTITEPPGNLAPNPVVINEPSCSGLNCNFSAVGTKDPNTGDTLSHAWNFGDPMSGTKNAAAGPASSHAFLAAGTYTVTLTATDGWGRATTVTRQLTVSNPAP